jgi:plasmid stabilization system protein ParE
MKVVYAERARRDIEYIYESIAPHNPAAAQRVENMIRTTCEGLADFPFASTATDEPNVRRVPLVRYPYTVFCRVDPVRDVVEIARVLHSARVRDLGKMPRDL